MTLGVAAGFIALGLAFAAAGVRHRDAFWGIASALVVAFIGNRIAQVGVDPTRFAGTSDGALFAIGLLLLAVSVTVTTGLPQSMEDRLFHGPASREALFARALLEARRPFVEAASARSDAGEELVRWRSRLAVQPPDRRWAELTERWAASDEEWVTRARRGSTREDWLPWEAANDQILAEWEALRRRDLGDRRDRARRAARLSRIAFGLAIALLLAGQFNLTNGFFSGPPAGRASVVPVAPPGRSVHFAPLGGFPTAQLRDLADFYAERYDIRVEILSSAPIPVAARDEARDQLVGEALVDDFRVTYPEAADPARIVIGVTTEDIYLRVRPDWSWAFGVRVEGHLAVLSTARMGPAFGPFGERIEAARLRKMVTKYIGALYYVLPESTDPRSVLYGNVLSVGDLDAMSEDF